MVNVTQCPQGSVEMGLYAASVGLLDAGVISGLDMTPEAALTKLMIILGTRLGDQIKLQMQINQRGEQSQNLFDLLYKAPRLGMSAKSYSEYAFPDRRFNRSGLSIAVLRLRGLKIEVSEGSEADSAIFVFMNAPKASIKDVVRIEKEQSFGRNTDVPTEFSHPRLVCTIYLKEEILRNSFVVVEALDNEKVKNIIGDSEITLSLVPTPGVSFSFEKLSLSLFTKA